MIRTKQKIKEDWFIGTSFCHVSAFFVRFKKSSIVTWVVLIKLELLSATIWQTRIKTHLSSFSRAHASLWNFQKTFCRYFSRSFYPEICQLTTLFFHWINPCSSSCHFIANKFPENVFASMRVPVTFRGKITRLFTGPNFPGALSREHEK